MNKVFLSICLILCTSVASSQALEQTSEQPSAQISTSAEQIPEQPSEQISPPSEQLSTDGEAQTPFGDYGRIALAILNASRNDTGKKKKEKPTFLSHISDDASLKIVAEAFKSNFSDEEAESIANFLESPEGQEGISSYSKWLLGGKFLKKSVPPNLPKAWKVFRATATGVKLFAKAYPLFKEMAVKAVKKGGKVVRKTIIYGIGPRAASQILNAVLKTL